MSWRNIRGRVDRLERDLTAAGPNRAPPYLWDVISGRKSLDDLPADDRARLDEWWQVRREEARRCRLTAVRQWVDQMRTDCVPPGVAMPTAEELLEREDRERGFCVIEELLRLVESRPSAH